MHLVGAASFFVFAENAAFAGPREMATRLYSRLASQNPSKETLDELEADIAAGDWNKAAFKAMSEKNFYNTTLKDWFTPMTNRDGSITRPLNDMSATLIGIVRDEDKANAVPFDEILSADVMYIPGTTAIAAPAMIPAYRRDTTDNYRNMEIQHLDLSDPTILTKSTQSGNPSPTAIDPKAIAGIMSSRQWASEYFSAGTNRRSFRFAAINFLCRDYEQMFDTSIPDEYVARDVDRAPGGDPNLYLRRCIGCHAGFNDPFRKAFAYYDFGGLGDQLGNGLQYKVGDVNGVPNKINDRNRQAVFVPYKNATVVDDAWVNLITVGVNKGLGWNAPRAGGSQMGGNGAASLGRTITATDAFAKCVSRRVFDKVCIRNPTVDEQATLDGTIAKSFQTGDDASHTNQYKIKPLFAKVSGLCLKE